MDLANQQERFEELANERNGQALLTSFITLNNEGQQKLQEYANMLLAIDYLLKDSMTNVIHVNFRE